MTEGPRINARRAPGRDGHATSETPSRRRTGREGHGIGVLSRKGARQKAGQRE